MPKWDEKAQVDLLTCLYAAVQHRLPRESQDEVVELMKAKGYEDVGWDSVRCDAISFC